MLFGFGFLGILSLYLFNGAGLTTTWALGFPGSVVIGWVRVMGLLVASGLSFAIGAGRFGFAANWR